ncbi:MAG TPA: GtrA family protein [Candidatus Omnitrophota bacterium]|nr:GtrA family protein [Candidatus Omnitrophota bacterium]
MAKMIFFLLGGVFNYAVKIGITVLLTGLLKLPYYVSYPVSLVAVIVFSFYYNFHVTFRSRTSQNQRFLAYAAALLLFIAADYLLVVALTGFLRLYYVVSIVISTTTIVVAKYLLFDRVVFNEDYFMGAATE